MRLWLVSECFISWWWIRKDPSWLTLPRALECGFFGISFLCFLFFFFPSIFIKFIFRQDIYYWFKIITNLPRYHQLFPSCDMSPLSFHESLLVAKANFLLLPLLCKKNGLPASWELWRIVLESCHYIFHNLKLL